MCTPISSNGVCNGATMIVYYSYGQVELTTLLRICESAKLQAAEGCCKTESESIIKLNHQLTHRNNEPNFYGDEFLKVWSFF